MASQSTGIQQLLTAEKRAADKVSEARKRKARRLKQAKEEAQAEIEAYRQKRELEYKEKEQLILGSRGDMEQQVERDLNQKLSEMNRSVSKNQETTIKRLLELVCDIKPAKHTNLRV